MTPVEQMVVGLPMAMALGLFFGLSACTISCLPYLGPVFLASDGGIRQSWRTLLPFSLGRLFTYAALGLAAGMAGQHVTSGPGSPLIRTLSGAAAMVVGAALLLRRRRGVACSAKPLRPMPLRPHQHAPRALLPGGLFLMGASLALSPCAPLGTILFSAATLGSATHGLLLGLGFGVGAIAIPGLVYGVGVAYFGTRLREQLGHWRTKVDAVSAGLLILTGGINLLA